MKDLREDMTTGHLAQLLERWRATLTMGPALDGLVEVSVTGPSNGKGEPVVTRRMTGPKGSLGRLLVAALEDFRKVARGGTP